MIAKERGRNVRGVLSALALVGTVGTMNPTLAQQAGGSRLTPVQTQGRTAPAQSTPAYTAPTLPPLQRTAIPVNPTDPIAVINDDVITRSQLADECVTRKGEEILETLIARKLIEQALKAKKLEVTAAEIDGEIDSVARRVAGIGREAWLRTLDKERGISPIQYARDIIYPALALRKLAAPSVVVTPNDVQAAFEAQYGDKLRCRIIMVDKVQTAKEIWEELRKNPNGFEKLAMERSMDSGSRSLGGLLAEPISRHAYPQTVSNAAFQQLVDGDATDKDPKHKPQDGSFTGPIQVDEAVWIILRREGIIPAAKGVDPNDPTVKKSTHDMIYEVKLKEEMGKYMVGLMEASKIDNKLTGRVKEKNEKVDYDKQVELTGNRPSSSNGSAAMSNNSPVVAAQPKYKTPTPAALSSEVVKESEQLSKPVKK